MIGASREPIRAVGIPWFNRDDYQRILRIMVDADKLPATYEAWYYRAERTERESKRSGVIVVRAIIDPDEFVKWCAKEGLNVDANARIRFGAEYARRKFNN
jgi:hypothetical protein